MVGFAGGFCWLISDHLGYFDITRIKGMWFPGNIQKTISHPEMIYVMVMFTSPHSRLQNFYTPGQFLLFLPTLFHQQSRLFFATTHQDFFCRKNAGPRIKPALSRALTSLVSK